MRTKSEQVDPDVQGQVDAALTAARVFVAIIAQSIEDLESEISIVQFRTLVIVATRGPMNVTALAETLGVHASNATRSCDRLVRAGLLTRTESAQDRRHLELALTPTGHALVKSVMTRRREALAAVIQAMAPAKRRQLSSGLNAFAEAANEPPDPGLWPTTESLPTSISTRS